MSANKIFSDVDGAPVKIGQRVCVVELVDPETFDYIEVGEYGSLDDAIDSLIGQEGVVVYLEYGCGSGQIYPDQPMIGVKLDCGDDHEFWFEELRKLL